MRTITVNGVKLSAVGLGTWQFGSRTWGYGADYAQNQSRAIVARSLDLGVTLIDTAELYGFGRSERIVGGAIVGRRQEVFLATKLLPVMPVAPVVLQRLRASLRRLGVEAVDLYQLHQPNPAVPLSSTMAAFGRLLDEGLIRHVGVSNYGLRRWQQAEAALGRPVLSNQVRYSLIDRRPEAELLPWAQANDRLVIAYSPLGQGLLSGRYDEDHPPTGAVRRGSPLFLPDNLRRARPLLDALRQVAAAHSATPAQVALAWVLRRPNVVVIPGASSVAQAETNAEAADLQLSEDEARALNEASETFVPVGGTAALSGMARQQAGGMRRDARQKMGGLAERAALDAGGLVGGLLRTARQVGKEATRQAMREAAARRSGGTTGTGTGT